MYLYVPTYVYTILMSVVSIRGGQYTDYIYVVISQYEYGTD